MVMKANDLCPSPHLEAADLAGKDFTVTIKGYDFHNVGAEAVRRGILFFEEFNRGLVLNRTNLKRIIGIYGNDADTWKGQKVTLYESEASFNGNTVPCIRVRDKKPA